MALLERTYTIPLRKQYMKAPKYKRAKKAATAGKAFLVRHMKSEDVRLGRHLNMELWKHGMKNPPCRIKITCQRDDKGVVRAELHGKPIEAAIETKAEKKGVMGKVADAITKPAEKKAEAKTGTKKPEPATPAPGTKAEPAKTVPLKTNTPATQPATPTPTSVKTETKPSAPVTKETLKQGEAQIDDAMKKIAEKTAEMKKTKK